MMIDDHTYMSALEEFQSLSLEWKEAKDISELLGILPEKKSFQPKQSQDANKRPSDVLLVVVSGFMVFQTLLNFFGRLTETYSLFQISRFTGELWIVVPAVFIFVTKDKTKRLLLIIFAVVNTYF